jgi:hypothetical protein
MDKDLKDFANAVAMLTPAGHKPMIRFLPGTLVPYVGFVPSRPAEAEKRAMLDAIRAQ